MGNVDVYVGSPTIPSAVTPLTSILFAGDSFTAGGNNGDSTTTRFASQTITKLNAALGWSATENNVGSGGARQFLNVGSGITAIGTQVYQAVTLPSAAPYVSPIQCAVIQASINNLNWTETIADIAGTIMFALKHQIHYLRSGGAYHALGGKVTYGGSYTTILETDGNWGTGVKRAQANGDTASLAVPSDFPGGTLYIAGPKTKSFGGVETVVLDSVTNGTSNNKDAVITEGSQPWVYPLPSLAAGTHTVGLTTSSIASVDNFNGAYFEAAVPPYVIVLNTARSPIYPGGTHTTTDTDVTNSNTGLTTMMSSEFSGATRLVVIDVDTILGKITGNFGADGIHPNSTGNGLIADAIVSAIRTMMGV